jgi:hypothetical protein
MFVGSMIGTRLMCMKIEDANGCGGLTRPVCSVHKSRLSGNVEGAEKE